MKDKEGRFTIKKEVDGRIKQKGVEGSTTNAKELECPRIPSEPAINNTASVSNIKHCKSFKEVRHVLHKLLQQNLHIKQYYITGVFKVNTNENTDEWSARTTIKNFKDKRNVVAMKAFYITWQNQLHDTERNENNEPIFIDDTTKD